MTDEARTRALVIGRRRKGRRIGEVVLETARLLEAAGWDAEARVVRRKRALRRHAAAAVEARLDVVVAVGGDGAVLQVVNALAESSTALGIVPRGTGNLLAGNLGVPARLDRAVAVLTTGRRRRIDLGRVTLDGGDHYFAVACGVGFDARVMAATGTSAKRRLGKLAYVVNAVREARDLREDTHEITIDGTRRRGPASQVLVANFGRIGSLIRPRREILPDDGLLDVIVIRAAGPLRGLLAGLEALWQRDLGSSPAGGMVREQAREIRVETRRPRLVETDGSVVGKTPVSIAIRPEALTVIEPGA